MIDVEQIQFARSSLSFIQKYADFYSTCFPSAKHLDSAYLNWLYGHNPSGEFVGADAWYKGSLIGQVVAIPGKYRLLDRYSSGLLAVNVAVHPKFQGRNLFKKLGLLMCDYGAEQGYNFVIGVSNRAATIGWTRQMGFQLVRQLDAKIGVGSNKRKKNLNFEDCQFSRVWDKDSLHWRTANPNNKIFVRKRGDKYQCFANAKGQFLPIYAEVPALNSVFSSPFQSASLSPLRLFLGIEPGDRDVFRISWSIPERFKPSPLNLIYKSLSGEVPRLDQNSIRFSFLDFDAY